MKILDNITLLTCTFNNNVLTRAMIMSCFKQLEKEIPVVIIDNGTTEFCTKEMKETFTVIDNTNHKILKDYAQTSKNHSAAVDYALKNLIKTKYVLLCDYDILFKKEVNNLFAFLDTFDNIDCLGEVGWDVTPPDRLFPYFCIINVDKFKNEKLSYFKENSFKLNSRKNCIYSDTGCTFYNDIKDTWDIKYIHLKNFIVHLKAGSDKKNITMQFLKTYKDLIV